MIFCHLWYSDFSIYSPHLVEMKIFQFSLLVYIFIFSVAGVSAQQYDAQQYDENGVPICPPNGGRLDGINLADPYNCNTYYQCNNTTPIKFSCPEDTQFDVAVLSCDWEENVQCSLLPPDIGEENDGQQNDKE
jgi:hypothetical protein